MSADNMGFVGLSGGQSAEPVLLDYFLECLGLTDDISIRAMKG